MKKIITCLLMAATVITFASCEKDEIVDVIGKGSITDNGGNTPETPTYELVTKHVSAMVDGMTISDIHEGILKEEDGYEIARDTYTAIHEVSLNSVTIRRSVAETLENVNIEADNNSFDLAGAATLTCEVTLTGCGTVYFKENTSTYCHPRYGVDGAIAKLTCCDPRPVRLELKSINGNVLNGFVVVKDHEEAEFPVEIAISEDPVKGYDTDDFATVTGNNESSLNVYPTIDGEHTGEVIVVKGAFNGSLKAGAQIEKTSKGAIRLNNTAADMSASNANFTYTLDGVSFSDVWAWSASSEALFTLPDGTSVVRPIRADYTINSTSFTANNGIYSNAATLYAGAIAIASDVQLLKVNAPLEPTYPGWKACYTDQWAITRVYDRNATRNLAVLTGTMMNETSVIAGFHIVLDGQAAANELPAQLQPLSAPSFTTPFSLFFNSRTSAWEYGSLRFADKGRLNTTWDYVNWNVTNNQPMSVNISQDVADDVVWLNDNIVVKNGVVSFSYNGKNYTIVSDTF